MSVTSLEEWRKKQELLSKSKSPSKANMTWDVLGVTPTESTDTPFSENVEQMIAFWIVLDKAQREPFKVKSNFARQAAWFIAVCASTGLITTEVEVDTFGQHWLITEIGIDFKEGLDESIQELM